MPKIGRSRRTTTNAEGDRWRRRAEAYERLVYMIRRAPEYAFTAKPDGKLESNYGTGHPMRELHEALLTLTRYKVIEINRDLSGVGETALWEAVRLWKQAAAGIEAIDRAADQIRDRSICTCGVWNRPRGHGENVLHAIDCKIRDNPDPTDEDK